MPGHRTKECYCHTCEKAFHSLGIARHRAMHRDDAERCEITYADGLRLKHNFTSLKAWATGMTR